MAQSHLTNFFLSVNLLQLTVARKLHSIRTTAENREMITKPKTLDAMDRSCGTTGAEVKGVITRHLLGVQINNN